ncbi:ABC transporter ATP-binding protein [Nocardioides zeae]|uniref:ABC transporter ATP-binding protein n=1 Tax=Nocardioides imazamoxiresistens TaxID=3231893 RepID=A0ABU3PQZ2_9ACTN|nr:ABC transporter ATP-binding protein [Nocardioides zeae]MDT9591638.1 ABC transporter ATP-binding protein [Nocardioides zeae]
MPTSAATPAAVPAAADGRPEEVVLRVEGLTLRYGSVTALNDVGFTVRAGETVALVGPNGAGKTSLFNCVSAFSRPTSGTLRFRDLDLTRSSRHAVPRAGIGRTFQNLSLFPGATVLENALVGRHSLMRSGMVANLAWWRGSRREDVAHREAVCEVLDLLGLLDLWDVEVGGLPYGTRKRVELARALAMEPTLLLMDEPVAGMNPAETAELTAIVKDLGRRRGLSVLVVEHDMAMVMEVADQITVLDFGQVIAQGTPAAIRDDQRVRDAYLGNSVERSTPAAPAAAETTGEA